MPTGLAQTFRRDGFVHLPGAIPERLARTCEALLWEETGFDPADPSTWTEPTRWVLYRDDQPFVDAVNTPALIEAYDTLVGAARWLRRDHVGAFPLRFPSEQEPVESGWHIDAAFADRELTDESSQPHRNPPHSADSEPPLRQPQSTVADDRRSRALVRH